MNIKDSVQTCFKKYVDFTGRASRSEYWWFFLFTIILEMAAYAINENLYMIVGLVFILPSIAVGVRRLHDCNKTGWLFLLCLIPIIGDLVLLYFMVIKGTEGPNTYGPPVV